MSRGISPPIECPVCGEAVPRTAKACPGCGADERSGWDEEATRYDGLDLPDADDEDSPPTRNGGGGRWWGPVVALLLVVLLLGMIFL